MKAGRGSMGFVDVFPNVGQVLMDAVTDAQPMR